MEKQKIFFAFLVFLVCTGFVFAVEITGNAISVDADYVTLFPGESGDVEIKIENNEDVDIEEVSVTLILDGLSFTTIGSSEKEIDDIDEDDSEKVEFSLKPSTEIIPGDYNIPYTIKYKKDDINETLTKQGSFGLRVSAKTEIDFSVETKDNILKRQGRVSIKMINKGLGEVKFISVEIINSPGLELISGKDIYIGTIESDDSDIATFDVIFNSEQATLNAKVEYKDFENNPQVKTLSFPIQVYTKEQALELGLIKKNNTVIYLGVIIFLVVLWFAWRKFKKYRKEKKRKENKK